MKFIAYWFSHCLGKKKHINSNSAPEPPRQLGERVILTYTITSWAAEFLLNINYFIKYSRVVFMFNSNLRIFSLWQIKSVNCCGIGHPVWPADFLCLLKKGD